MERNNNVFKDILVCIQRKNTATTLHHLVQRASFFTNMFHENKVLSSFQLARGYASSIAGIPSSQVHKYILEAHIKVMASRAVQKSLFCKSPNTTPQDAYKKGLRIFVYYNTTKQNDLERWIKARLLSTGTHMLKCRCTAKGPPMTVAYDHVRIAPNSELARELMFDSLEDILSRNNKTFSTAKFPDDEDSCQVDKLLSIDNVDSSVEELPAIDKANQTDFP